MHRPLTPGESAVLGALLSADFHGAPELRRQAATAVVIGGSECGCPSIELSVPDAEPTAPLPDGLAPIELRISPIGSEPTGDVILFLRDGRLSYLEYVYYTDTPPSAWPETSRLSLFPALDE